MIISRTKNELGQIRNMKIAQIAPIIERVPPKKYGGTERVVYTLTENLLKRGHEVTLFASGDSLTSGTLQSIIPRSMRELGIRDLYGLNEWPLMNLGQAYKMQSEFDLIHDHHHYISLPTSHLAQKPVIMTLHGPVTVNQKKMFSMFNNPHVVTISHAQLPNPGQINHAGVIHNGLDMENYPFSAEHEGYLLFVGRMSEEKGVHVAIEVARTLGLPLIIAAKLDRIDRRHFEEKVEPYLNDNQIKWVGEVDEHQRNDLMSKAMCLLHPISFREPFGLNMIEAMACGCPVIAFRRGSIPEIIEDGKTGFIVEDTVEMIEKLENIDQIDRAHCREHSLTNFNADKMTDAYEEVYRQVLEADKQPLDQIIPDSIQTNDQIASQIASQTNTRLNKTSNNGQSLARKQKLITNPEVLFSDKFLKT